MFNKTVDESIKQFFTSSEYGVVGASNDRAKYGNKVLRCYMHSQKKVWPVHPSLEKVEGLKVVHHVEDLPKTVQSISIITPPSVTEQIVEEAATHGIKNIWMQPGAESARAVQRCYELGIQVIAGGPCILVVLGFHE